MRRPNAALVLALTVAWLVPAAADMPYPTNPMPCDGTDTGPPCIDATAFAQYLFLPATTPLTLPDDFGNDWKLSSGTTGIPAIDGSAQELFGVTGASVDRAWQTTTGRPDVLIAVLDSGIQWAEPQADLVNKFYLNRGELPAPEGSTNPRDAHDRNGDGLFNIADYLADGTHVQDARVSDQNGNGVIDPEDLIFIFSNGVDGDDNGYVDDISGWDFFEDDNDPLDEVRYGHGTGESRDSGAEADNGSGGVGTCPNCLLLAVRVGDSFVTEVNAFARGVVFAVDSGAGVVQEALGTLNNSRFGQEAVDYAYGNGVVVIASAADEESAHHNYPANYNHTVQVNSVTRFADLAGFVQEPRSYLYLNGCTNYGAHITLAVPSLSCSSEATGLSSGMAGLVVSAAQNAIDRGMLERYPRDDGSPATVPLSAEEIKQVLIQTADDINCDARDDVTPRLPQNYGTFFLPWPSERFHSIAGFDHISATAASTPTVPCCGRLGTDPPEAAIESPAWFDVIDPQAATTLTIAGRVAANRAASYRYVVEVAPGVQPREADFEQVGGQEALTGAVVGPLGEIDLAALAARLPRGVEGPPTTDAGEPDPDRFTVTVRIRVVDDQGNAGEDRRAFALHHDDDLLPGFPRLLGGDGASAAATADLDADGREEIILGTSDGAVHATGRTGATSPGGRCAPTRSRSMPTALATRAARSPRRCTARSSAACRSAISTATARWRWSPPTCRAASTCGAPTASAAPASRSRPCPTIRSPSAPSATSRRRTARCPTAPTGTTKTTASAAPCSAASRSATSTAPPTARSRSSPGPTIDICTHGVTTARRFRGGRCCSRIRPRWRRLIRSPTRSPWCPIRAHRSAPRSSCHRRSAISTATAPSRSWRRSTRNTSGRSSSPSTPCSRTASFAPCRAPACWTAATRASTRSTPTARRTAIRVWSAAGTRPPSCPAGR
jgi:hypothetical protein